MTAFLALGLVIAIQGVLCASTPCSGDIKAKTRDGQSCYECGKSKLTAPTEPGQSTVGKQAASLGDFPWNAAVYMRRSSEWDQICGGTLVTSQAVLTAAHCVTEILDQSQPVNVNDIRVITGKVHKSWDASEPTEIKRKVKEILAHPDYHGSILRYANDVALLILDSEVPLSSAVMPACLDYNLNQQPLYENNAIGYISGFGYTQECRPMCTDPTETLKYSSTNVSSFDQCYNKFQTFNRALPATLTPDKVCIGNGKDSPIQRGDSGFGFTVIAQGLHYVTGVASVKFIGSGDNKLSYGALTNVSRHMDWLRNSLPE